ncbi:hydroxyphenylacetyl-CoA thioesterase PaaI [Pseudaestuariivita sp.]|uniref:hydroxyphenylacetyl-CoA thioesterase PaaI n=1 Tax=Pseudaestuariivita sp. TaxID=2211669 RepID=UPI0040586B9A
MEPDATAAKVAELMWSADQASQALGMRIVEVASGRAVLEMTVATRHLNGHWTCHGGMIFSLADSAFAFACNSHNQMAVAQHCSVTFLAPGREGDVLTADAREVTTAGRSGLYDVTVTRQDGTRIAEFRGHSRTIPGTHFEEETT